MVHSITTSPEKTVLVESVSGGHVGTKWSDNALPQQLHVSKLPSGSLSLGPGQLAVVPITFLPRFPERETRDDQDDIMHLDDDVDDDEDDDYVRDNNSLDDTDHFYRTGRSPPPLSSTARVDLIDLVGERVLKVIENGNNYYHRNNKNHRGGSHSNIRLDDYLRSSNLDASALPRGDKYEVTTTVRVSTSRGDMNFDVTVSSIRENPYGIPDVIKVRHPHLVKAAQQKDCSSSSSSSTEVDGTGSFASITSYGVVIMDIVHARDDRQVYGGEMPSERDCYDVYMKNPLRDKELQIKDALVSRPEVMSLHLDPPQKAKTTTPTIRTSSTRHTVGRSSSKPQYTQVIRYWTSDGPLTLPPGNEKHYILTVCTASEGEVQSDEASEHYLSEMSNWIDSGNPSRDLGFLQIRTDSHALFVALEHDELSSVSSLKNEPVDGTNRTRLKSPASSSPRSSGTPVSANAGTSNNRLLKSYPASLELDMMSTTSPMVQAKVGLQNKSPVPIRIMRVSVGMDTFGDLTKIQEAQQIGLTLIVNVRSDGKSDYKQDPLDSLVLGSATSLDDVLVLSCSLNPDGSFPRSRKESFEFNGTVIVRGTMDTELTYQEWRDETLRNPFRDDHLTLELPFSISILNGRIEALIERSTHPYPQLFAAQPWDNSGRVVSYLFFPMTQFQADEGTEGVLPSQNYIGSNEIRHDLRILSNMVFPLSIESAEVVDATETSSEVDSLCGRFNVSTMPPSELAPAYQGFEEIGSLTLRYRFGTKQGGENHKDTLPTNHNPAPTSCFLNVRTSPQEAGIFRIPLMIFSSHLDVATTDPFAGSSQNQDLSTTNIRVGYNNLLSWSRSTRIGQALLSVLSKLSGDRRKTKNDSLLLSKYVSQFSRRSSSQSKAKLHPILLEIGAIDLDEIAKIPLFFTNINPVPISVSIDVAAVEGSTIVLGRDASQTQGDGNCLVDHLPLETTPDLLSKGKYKGHPISGLLQFLTSSEKTLEFISEYSFRDSVSLNKVAAGRLPVLRHLYDWHSKTSFRRTQLPSRFTGGDSSHCKENLLPPIYMSINDSNKTDIHEGIHGAMLVSGDKTLARRLNRHLERGSTLDARADGTIVQIPPGGTARFEIYLRAPSKEYLDNDISELLATGLVLSTNLGDVMPIFAVFEALQGQIQASHVQPLPQRHGGLEVGPQLEQHINTTIIHVPLELFWESKHAATDPEDSSSVNSPTMSSPSRNSIASGFSNVGVPLYLKSSFSLGVRLLNIESCNPWFQFVPSVSGDVLELHSKGGVKVGHLRTAVMCSQDGPPYIEFPSYYQCIFNWLAKRIQLQPEGCGLKRIHDSSANLRKLENVRKAVENALHVLNTTYADASTVNFSHPEFRTFGLGHVKTRDSRRNDGLISNFDSFSALWDSMKNARAYGYDRLSSSLRATVEYKFQDAMNATIEQNLSLLIHDLEVKTVLEPPRLFDPPGGRRDNSLRNVLEFSSTPIASVAKTVISLRNPTGVPVRVRLGVVQKQGKIRSSQPDDPPVDRRFAGVPPPYVQNGKIDPDTYEAFEQLWWDGNGAYFLSDSRGDVIRSHHNITIRAGADAFVSLVNPSLHGQVGFLVGCGARCGIRDETSAGMVMEHPMSNSPIGASAAAGITLSGVKRSSSPQSNALVGPEPVIFAGGIPLPNTGGPSAFAIPYSALDEIVIPPYGKGELGPIFFRPPGRNGVIGCDVAKESGAKLLGEKIEYCDRDSFEAIVYLENTLTGLEEIVLRGKSAWDRVYFVDPPPREGQDAFGDIEFRSGRPTLLFSGTSIASEGLKTATLSREGSRRLSVIKEVVLQNDGDAAVHIEMVYLSSIGLRVDRAGVQQRQCTHGTFRLLDCSDQNEKNPDSGSWNSGNVITRSRVEAGENRSFFVEHVPDCSTKEEFVTLIVRLAASDSSGRRLEMSVGASIPGERRPSRSNGLQNPSVRKEVSLIVGYQMDNNDFARCTPASTRDGRGNHKMTASGRPARSSKSSADPGYPVPKTNGSLIFEVVLMSGAAWLLCYALRARFNAMWSMLQKMPKYLVERGRQNGLPIRKLRSHWNAAFRCLARADPASTELQMLSREQMRQVVLGQYKAMGMTPPAALSGAYAFVRDRRNRTSSAVHQRSGKDNTTGNERIRTLSESIFHDTNVAHETSLRKSLPVGLGWRSAYSRGILKDTSIYSTKLELRTRALRQQRSSKSYEKASENTDESYFDDEEGDYDAGSHLEDDSVSSPQKSDDPAMAESNGDAAEAETIEVLNVTSTSEDEGTDPNKFELVESPDNANDPNRHVPSVSNKHSERSEGLTTSIHTEKTGGRAHEPTAGGRNEHEAAKKDAGFKIATHDRPNRRTKAPMEAAQGNRHQLKAHSDKAVQAPLTRDRTKEEETRRNGPSQKVLKQKTNKGDRPKAGSSFEWKDTANHQKNPKSSRTQSNAKGKLSPSENYPKHRKYQAEVEKNQSAGVDTSVLPEPILRPPPGLAPPPGFAGSMASTSPKPIPNVYISSESMDGRQDSLTTVLDSALSYSEIDLPLTPSRSDVPLHFTDGAAGGSDFFFTRNIGGLNSTAANTAEDTFNFPVSQSPTMAGHGIAGSRPQADGTLRSPGAGSTSPALLNETTHSQDGFDVMEFLDSILNERAPLDDAREESEVPPSTAAVVGIGNSITPVLDNPWATEGRSRAAAYGISFDEDDDNSSNGSQIFNVISNSGDEASPGFGRIPLLTPAAILNAEQDKDVDDGDMVVSFYSGLVDE